EGSLRNDPPSFLDERIQFFVGSLRDVGGIPSLDERKHLIPPLDERKQPDSSGASCFPVTINVEVHIADRKSGIVVRLLIRLYFLKAVEKGVIINFLLFF